MSNRLLIFLYGRRNLMGCLLALAGLGLLFGGVIKHYWPFIVAGLYVLGYLLTPPEPAAAWTGKPLDTDRIEDALDDLLRSVSKRLPGDVVGKAQGIRDGIVALLPSVAELRDIAQSHNIHVIHQTALVYLPEILNSYLRLPAAFARLHPVKDGKTARELLLDQLDILDAQIKKIAVDIHQKDMDALVIHGRFLEEKFGAGMLKLD